MENRFIAVLGIIVIIGIAVIFSKNRQSIEPRIVLRALALHIVIAVSVLYLPIGVHLIEGMATGINLVLGYADAGKKMMFGELASDSLGSIFAFQVLPIVVFFSALMAVLYFLKIMQFIVACGGFVLQKLLGTGAIESLNAVTNIFIGMTESPLAVRPYLNRITSPQLFAIMVSGMASVAGTVLAAYAQMGIEVKYLLAASFMAAPGGLLMAKIIMPDTVNNKSIEALSIKEIASERSEHTNIIMAAATGAQEGLKLALNIGAMLVAFIALIALANGILGGFGSLFGFEDISAQKILGWIFAPLMYLLSIPWEDATLAGTIFGEKIILNEFVAYLSLADQVENLSPRSVIILTFALCGFANLGSIAVLMGGLGALVPERLKEIASFGPHAVFAASLSNLLSAAMAGLLLA